MTCTATWIPDVASIAYSCCQNVLLLCCRMALKKTDVPPGYGVSLRIIIKPDYLDCQVLLQSLRYKWVVCRGIKKPENHSGFSKIKFPV